MNEQMKAINSHGRSRKGWAGFKKKFMRIDLFGKPFNFKLPNLEDQWTSKTGVVFSIVIAILCLSLLISKMVMLLNQDDSTFQNTF